MFQNINLRKIPHFMASVLLTCISGLNAVVADDTEVFFGAQTAQSTAYPNVLFILDTSGSMSAKDGTGITRLDRMKTAVEQILDSATNINVGMMRYNGYNSGGSIIFPVTYIDKELCPNGVCSGASPDVALTVRVDRSEDDASEATDSLSMTLDDNVLSLFNVSGNAATLLYPTKHRNDDAEQRISNSYLMLDSWDLDMFWDVNWQKSEGVAGIRIPDIDVPNDATITSAKLLLQGDPNVANGLVGARIYAEDIDDSPRFENANGKRVLDRVKTTDYVDWDAMPFPVHSNDGYMESPDLSALVQGRLQDPNWQNGNAMTFLLENNHVISTPGSSNNRRIIPYGYASASNVPRLELSYSTSASSEKIGLRFNDVRIPQGVTISNATLEFTSEDSHSASTSATIYGHDTDSAPAFSNSNGNITGRTKTSASVGWTPESWTSRGETYQTSDITDIVQEIANRSGWCGGNSMAFILEGSGLRQSISFDQSPNEAPALKIEYDATTTPSDGGCTVAQAQASIAVSSDDVEERSNGDMSFSSSDLELPRDGSTEQVVGMRFRNLLIPNGATITSAKLRFVIDEEKSGSTSLTIQGVDSPNAGSFSSALYHLSNLPKTTASVDWNDLPVLSVGETLSSPDIAPIVQEIVDKSDWQSGNTMALVIDRKSGTYQRTVESYDGDPTRAAQLTVAYRVGSGAGAGSGQITYMTTRDKLKLALQDMKYRGGTPSVEALYEAGRYFKGLSVDYGTERGFGGNKHRYHRVSHPDSYTGGSLSRPANCSDDDLNNKNCKSEKINGSAQYISPMNDTCQTNHIVMLSDGSPTSSNAINKVKSMVGINSCTNRGSGTCGEELAYYLKNNDQSSTVVGTQDITTYTIGFNFTSDWMRDVAVAGGGTFYEADSSAQLVDAFNNILAEILKVDTSFVSPGTTVNQFNRLTHRNDIYFSLFKPSEKPTWDGNLKQYRLEGNPPILVDADNNSAVDENSGFFKDGARSFWSAHADGSDVALGGAAHELDVTTRQVFTNVGNNANLTDNSNAFHEDNANLTKELMSISGQSDAFHDKLVRWSRGMDVDDENNDGSTTDTRFHMGDPMHSRPFIINYSETESVVFVGTNEGFLHAIDADDGSEVFSFIPVELLPNLSQFYANQSSIDHPYGLDGPIAAWKDPDSNKRYLFVSMRRGGNTYYALDITSMTQPKILWKIDGDTSSGFGALGQTWSKPISTRVRIGGTEKDVLLFAGGYDTNQDHVNIRTPDAVGNALYMVDIHTGNLIWNAGPSGSGAKAEFSDMNYSMPADISAIDTDLDGLADQMYIGDMGGQLWRFDIDNYASSANSLVTGGVMAVFSDGSESGARRFYYAPNISLMSHEGEQSLAIAIGSGWRAHPLDLKVEDRFYMVRSDAVHRAPDGYGKDNGSGSFSPITESDLVDVTNDLSPDMTTGNGWRMDMEIQGEKVLAKSITVDSKLIFTTYRPEQAASACAAALGGGATYVVSIRDGSPTTNLNGVGEDADLSKDDRSVVLEHGGIPPEAVVMFPSGIDNTSGIDPIVFVGAKQFKDLGIVPGRAKFWRNNPESGE